MRRVVAVACCAVVVAVGLTGCDPPANQLVGAGDIASCALSAASRTADLTDHLDGTVVTFGDNAYQAGTASEFANCYRPTWGRHDGRVRPAPGNHEYGTAGAAGYFGYFGDRAGPQGAGFYSFDVGSWRVFSLNSEANISAAAAFVRSHAGGKRCIAAYWHKPLVSSGEHGDNPSVLPLWQAVYDVGGDLVLNGHDHSYERFAELGRDGAPLPGGMRELVVGTGGAAPYSFRTVRPGSRVRRSGTYGVITVDLKSDGYSWKFHPVAGQTFTDSGTGDCS